MKCEICDEMAENLCLTCNSYSCESCFKFIHGKKKNQQHIREKIDLYVPIVTKCPIHPDNPVNLFCLNEKELCCSLCQFLKPHEGHKLILINDEETLKKENLTLDSISSDFDKVNEQILNLSKEVQEEIIKIDNLYQSTNKKVTEFFEEKRKKLLEEQNNLIDKFKNEVTKTKEKLEKYLSECNEILKNNEKINKGIIKAKNDKDNNLRRTLSYISAVNKNNKKTDLMLNHPLKNLKINFSEKECVINYEEYIFNTIGIKCSNILNENDINLLISWLPNKPSAINLLFDTVRDGDNSSTFHEKCDGKYPTLIIIKSNTDYIFGGYVTSAWVANNNNINAPNSFVFSLNQKQKYYATSQQNSIINGGDKNNQKDSMMFKIGCCDIQIKHNCTANNQNGTNCDKFSVQPQNLLNGGNRYFTVRNLEVYEIK